MGTTVSVRQLLVALQTLHGVLTKVPVPPTVSCRGVPRLLPRQAANILNRVLRSECTRLILMRVFLFACPVSSIFVRTFRVRRRFVNRLLTESFTGAGGRLVPLPRQ